MLRHALLGLCLFACVSLAPAQAEAPPPSPAPAAQDRPDPVLDATTAEALQRLAELLADKRRALAEATARGDAAALPLLETEMRQLAWQFAGLAARENVQEFEAPATRRFDLQAEIEQLLRPVVQSLKEATVGPRQVADLEARLDWLRQRLTLAGRAAAQVERTAAQLPAGSAARAEAERELALRWRPAQQTLRDEILVVEANLARHRQHEKSVFDAVTGALRAFARNSGANLLLAAATFALVFFGLRFVLDRLVRPGRQQRSFPLRLLTVALRVAALVAALAASLVVPYVRNDWFLLAVGIVFLVGAGWVVVRMLPQLVEQLRLVLNIGGVREGERMVVDGVPFRVAALGFRARLENPELQGGVLRVPLQFLVGRRSRASGHDEPWFPSRQGDVVLLADGAFGTVAVQTPDVVVVEQLGASRTYTTSDFLRLSPRNLSRGFVVDALLLLGRVPPTDLAGGLLDRLAAELADALRPHAPAGAVRAVRVQLQQVTVHGYELLAQATCDGAAAPAFLQLRRAMQQAFVAACGRHGWPLPAPAFVAPAG
jgi:hypothetical protein